MLKLMVWRLVFYVLKVDDTGADELFSTEARILRI